ncbi:histidine phosphatase family protein [Bacillus sp. BHET2]|uniref:histidine phosphatase family protein n=1 Tax=Bacillus sp. BHET2 TaxID=2583818 RepID=UPI00110EB032|nr:histidine phosphatase family protein [Bacillus sp. BHET2]TMU87024.1 histidine phosphatase family protein [Bacillus sp. BHET2]
MNAEDGEEITRGLTDKRRHDAELVTRILRDEGIDVVISSPYNRSILTVQKLAEQIGQEVIIFENLKERMFSAGKMRVSDKDLYMILNESFTDPHFRLPSAESNHTSQKRAVNVLIDLLDIYKGRKLVIGTHGLVMTLMMSYFDKQYDMDFLLNTSKPDIYRMEFKSRDLVGVKRLWEE